MISAQDRTDRESSRGDIGLFNIKTDVPVHRFNVGLGQVFSPGALAVEFGTKIFCACKVEGNQHNGIGVWDMHTGQRMDFCHDNPGFQFSNASKIQ